MKSKYLFKMAMASAGGLLVTGAAFAANPIPFDQYSVTAGTITPTVTDVCNTGMTCTSLDATSNGMLMQSIFDPGTGLTYLRTITTEAGVTGTPANLEFAMEANVYANGINSNNIALKETVRDTALDLDMTAEIFEGNWRSDGNITDTTALGGGAQMLLTQSITTAGQLFQQQGVNGNTRQRIDQNLGTNPGRFTYSQVDGTTFMPTVAGTIGGTIIPALAYASTDGLSAVWIGADQPGSGSSANRQFGYQEIRNWGSVASSNPGTNAPVAVSEYMDQGALGAFLSNGSWEWPTAIFDLGVAPTGP